MILHLFVCRILTPTPCGDSPYLALRSQGEKWLQTGVMRRDKRALMSIKPKRAKRAIRPKGQ